MGTLEDIKQAILKNYPRLGPADRFSFNCHPGLSCFTHCCGDITIALNPYDIIRLKNRLGLSSGEFLDRYTVSPFTKEQPFPIRLLKMSDDEYRRCPFVKENGCTVYEDRPWPCRMYPVGLATPSADSTEKEFFFLMKEMPCEGFKEGREWTIREWLEDQGIEPYNEQGQLFAEITLHRFFRQGGMLKPAQVEMFHTVAYDIDKFRDFVFQSTFLKRFYVEPEVVEKIKGDDVELLKFGYRWLRYSLFREPTMEARTEAVEAVKAKQEKK